MEDSLSVWGPDPWREEEDGAAEEEKPPLPLSEEFEAATNLGPDSTLAV